CQSGPEVRSKLGGFTYGAELVPWWYNSYTFNGLLQFYPQSGVNTPAMLPMYWEGMGKAKVAGGVYFNPLLNCPDATQPCVYKPRLSTGCDTGNGSSGNLFA